MPPPPPPPACLPGHAAGPGRAWAALRSAPCGSSAVAGRAGGAGGTGDLRTLRTRSCLQGLLADPQSLFSSRAAPPWQTGAKSRRLWARNQASDSWGPKNPQARGPPPFFDHSVMRRWIPLPGPYPLPACPLPPWQRCSQAPVILVGDRGRTESPTGASPLAW